MAKTLVRLFCKTCGNPFEVHPYRAKKAKYCSRKCRGIATRGISTWNKKEKIKLICQTCDKTFYVHPYRKSKAKYCSLDCRPQAFHKNHTPWNKDKLHPKCAGKNNYFYGKSFKGRESPSWKNGKIIDSGYIMLYKPNHPYCGSKPYIREHRLVMEKHLGRYLLPEERVHHKNENKLDNRIENLMYFISESAHQKFHHFLKCD